MQLKRKNIHLYLFNILKIITSKGQKKDIKQKFIYWLTCKYFSYGQLKYCHWKLCLRTYNWHNTN